MNIATIATLIYIALLLVYGVISAAVIYHLRRYYLPDDQLQKTMAVAYFSVSGVLVVVATYFFTIIEWDLISITPF